MRILLVLLGLGTSVAAGAAQSSTPSILVVGDSLSAAYGINVGDGWVALLDKRLKEQGYGYRVVNASISGETTGGARVRLARLLELHRPAIMILELGANDGLRGLPLEQVRGNLESMIRLAGQNSASVLLVGMRIPPNYGPDYAEGFFSLFGDLARTHKVSLLPFFMDGIALQEDLFLEDGIHPSAVAQPQLLENVWSALRPLLRRAG